VTSRSPRANCITSLINKERLRQQLILHEALKLKPYKDTVGKITIGIGHNLTDKGMHPAVVQLQYEIDVKEVEEDIQQHLPWVFSLDEVRQRVIYDMVFNMGIYGVLKFKNTLATIQRGDYAQAADMMMDSLWAHQVGDGPGGKMDRAERLSEMMRTGNDYTK
jgi:lysozyme